jgi:hypothetical protein
MDLSLTNISLVTLQHLYLSIIGTIVGGAVGFGLAVWLRSHTRWIALALGLAEIIQTIPGRAAQCPDHLDRRHDPRCFYWRGWSWHVHLHRNTAVPFL